MDPDPPVIAIGLPTTLLAVGPHTITGSVSDTRTEVMLLQVRYSGAGASGTACTITRPTATWTCTWHVESLPPGGYSIEIVATDAAGNAQHSFQAVLVNAAPAPSVNTAPPAPTGDRTLRGTPARDLLDGGPHNDLLLGGAGNDRLRGNGGGDRLFGGPGNDLLLGGRGNDRLVGGPGRDELNGGSGADLLDARDHRGRDRVACGPGRDTVLASPEDVVARDCERVRR